MKTSRVLNSIDARYSKFRTLHDYPLFTLTQDMGLKFNQALK